MSGFFGIFNRKGKAVDKKVVNDMLTTMSSWSPDEQNVWVDGPVALGHTMLWNTPESKYEHLPLGKNSYVLTMNARIDNRDELMKELELPNLPVEEIGDSKFILAAYQKWGEECPKYLLGDFAFAIWDEKKKCLFCARDQIGIKSIYYTLENDLFIFSNDMKCLLSNRCISRTLNKDMIAIFLRDKGVHSKENTFFEHIKKLPPATSISVFEEKIVRKNYWKVEDTKKINYSHYDDYIDELQQLLEKSVKARLRTTFPVASHLTGGIDSSPLAVIAAKSLSKKDENLFAFNWINVPDNESDYEEKAWKFSREIAEDVPNIIHEEFNITPEYMAEMYDKYNIFTEGTMFFWRENYIQARSRELGIRTIFSGYGGDELISNNGVAYLPHLFYSGKLIRFLKYVISSKKRNPQLGILTLVKLIIQHIRMFNPFINSNSSNIYDSKDCEYIYSDFIEYMKKNNYKGVPLFLGIRNDQIESLNYGHLQTRIESWALTSMSNQIEYVYPLLDRRIVEFAVGIPEELYIKNSKYDRTLIRQAIEKYLPPTIVWSPKEQEIRISKKFKKDYTESLKYWIEKHKNDKVYKNENNIIDYNKIIKNLSTFDFKTNDPYKLGKVVANILVANAIATLD